MKRFTVDLVEVIDALSLALDLIDPRLTDHHRQVALLAVGLAEQMRLPVVERQRLAMAALLHDIGATGTKDALLRLRYEYLDDEVQAHAEHGYRLLIRFAPLAEVVDIVRFHHVPWSFGRGSRQEERPVPLAAHILQLADRVQVQIDRSRYILSQVEAITARIVEERGRVFHPAVVDAFLARARNEAFWLDLVSPWQQNSVLHEFGPLPVDSDDSTLLDIARFFGRVIDSRSHFTATHSAGVAAVAGTIGGLCGLCDEECGQLRLAGYLHDIGKLAIPKDILEKPAALTPEEFALMRSHTYHTQRVLERIDAFRPIATWASHHHERFDGSGYPFGIKGAAMSLCARIMAVADVFTALTEDRPYRKAMKRQDVIATLKASAAANGLDPLLVGVVTRDFEPINTARREAQSAYQEAGEVQVPLAPQSRSSGLALMECRS